MLASHSKQMHGQKVSLEFERAVTALDIGTNPDMRHMRPCPQARNLCPRVAPADADSARFRYCFQLPTTTRLVTCVVWHTTQKESICNKILRGAAALPGRRVKQLVSMFSQSRHQITTLITHNHSYSQSAIHPRLWLSNCLRCTRPRATPITWMPSYLAACTLRQRTPSRHEPTRRRSLRVSTQLMFGDHAWHSVGTRELTIRLACEEGSCRQDHKQERLRQCELGSS